MRSREHGPSRDLYALVFLRSRLGRNVQGELEQFLELSAARAESILRRAFLGDADLRAVVEACWGPIDWMEIIETVEAR